MILRQWKQVMGLELPIKTQTRQPVKERDWHGYLDSRGYEGYILAGSQQTVTRKGQIKWQVGRTYAVQRPDGKTVGRFLLAKIRRERLGDILEADCLAEGVQYDLGGYFIGESIKQLGEHIWHMGRFSFAKDAFARLWDECYAKGAWDRMKDDDVWVLEWPPVEGGEG